MTRSRTNWPESTLKPVTSAPSVTRSRINWPESTHKPVTSAPSVTRSRTNWPESTHTPATSAAPPPSSLGRRPASRPRRTQAPLLVALLLATALLSSCADDRAVQNHFLAPDGDVYRLATTLLPFTWSAEVREVGLDATPGGSWTCDVDAVVDLSRHEHRYGRFTELILAVQGERRHDADGTWRPGFGTIAATSTFTTGGMPVERFDGWPTLTLLHGRDGSPLEAVHVLPLPDDVRREHRISATLTVELPPDTPVGWYEPRLLVFVRVEGVDEPVLVDNFGDNANTQDEQLLPLVRVGEAATPRLPMLLTDHSHYRGRTGVMPDDDAGRVALVARSGFPARYVLPPATRTLAPGFPSLFPEAAMPPIDGGLDVIPESVRSYLDPASLHVTFDVIGPGGRGADALLTRRGYPTLKAFSDGWTVDMTAGGEYVVTMTATVSDVFGRPFVAGGVYRVQAARPLSFSTSVKPGSPFLVGDGYPAKVNVNPPVPADVLVEVDWYPASDRQRKQTWRARGSANRFGHFVPYGAEPLRFDEPGEYVSRVLAEWVAPDGMVWAGDQTSAGVVAPVEPTIHLHGTRSPPHNLKVDEDWYGGVERFAGRIDASAAFLPFKPGQVPDLFAPYHPQDILFIQADGFKESIIEPQLSISVDDPELAATLQEAHRIDSVLPPPTLQLGAGDYYFLQDVVQISVDSAAWFPADAAHIDELPVQPVGDGRWHPFAHPEGNRYDGSITLGVIRPGFPVMTSVFQSDAIGLYWLASPNRFGNHLNAGGGNGDLPGDFYRIMASAVLRDQQTGQTWYDAYSAPIAVADHDGAATAIVEVGDRPQIRAFGRDHFVFVGLDSHDALEIGETMYLGGMVSPAVPADVVWTVTTPGGETVEVVAHANRLGIVRGRPGVPVDQEGLYRVTTDLRYRGLSGDIVGTADGSFWHAGIDPDGPRLLETTLGPTTPVDPVDGVEIPLRWSDDITDAQLHFGVIMPGRVLDQGVVREPDGGFDYRFSPFQVAVQHPNFDVRDFRTGKLALADTVVFQFVLEGSKDGEKVWDSLRMAIRADTLFSFDR